MFNQEQADAVCELLQQGKSLRASCAELGLNPSTILLWTKSHPDFCEQYTRAREIAYRMLADEILAISDEQEVEAKYEGEDIRLELSATAVARNRLRVDTRKWMLSKMLPKIYGDKVQVGGDKENPVAIEFTWQK